MRVNCHNFNYSAANQWVSIDSNFDGPGRGEAHRYSCNSGHWGVQLVGDSKDFLLEDYMERFP